MIIETINNQRVLTPDENMWLYNESQQVISDKVYLGIEADANDWSEITDERKQELEALWYEDATSGDTDTATVEDYQNALTEFGVEL
jgi:hypothetical protein